MKSVLDMLETASDLYPDKTAFTDPFKSITFKELRDRARLIGYSLYSGRIMDPEDDGNAICFYMEKSVDSVCAMFGGVYCNAFYSYIDTRQSADRVRHILIVVSPKIVVTDETNEEKLRAIAAEAGNDFKNLKIVKTDDLLAGECGTKDYENFYVKAKRSFYDRQPLYVNFTSGSTGLPKGVAVSHASVIDFITVFAKTFGIDSGDIIANQAPFDFDVSVKDIYSGLFTGAEVVLIPRSYFSNPMMLMDYLTEHQVTVLIWAVTALCFVSIMNGLGYKNPLSIRKIMFSGEVMPVKQLNKWKQYLPDAMYVNLYGPTEITCNCTYHILDRDYEDDEVIPIGRAFDNEKVFLLDDKDKLITGADTEGEICVTGSCLALGYYRDLDKTEQAFTLNPLNDRFKEIMYRTGDLGKYDEKGLLYYCSRKDFQIKHMGQRIELGDIEAAAMSVKDVMRTCCIYDTKRSKIVLFYMGGTSKEELSAALREKLPQFMVPGKTVCLDEFPMNKNGKIDRNALKMML